MPDIHHAIRVTAPPDTVVGLVATAAGLKQRWAEDATSEADGRVSLGFFNRATVYRLRLLERGGDRVSWRCESGDEWHDTELVFVLRAEPGSVAIEFFHAKWRAETPYFVSCNTTWGELMFRLKAAAEGERRGPLFRRDSSAY